MAQGRKRKTRDVWEVQGQYGQGWECVTAEETFREARQRLREYRDNEPQYAHRVRLTREKIAPQGRDAAIERAEFALKVRP